MLQEEFQTREERNQGGMNASITPQNRPIALHKEQRTNKVIGQEDNARPRAKQTPDAKGELQSPESSHIPRFEILSAFRQVQLGLKSYESFHDLHMQWARQYTYP